MLTLTTAILALSQSITPAELTPPDWLEGCWTGTGLGSPAMECWMSSPGGPMTGMFQLLDENGDQIFSEIMLIDTFDDGPALRLKHFDAQLIGWEAADEYVNFAFVEQTPTSLVFNGLEMHLQPSGALFIDVVLGEGEDLQTARFEYVRAD